MRIAFHRIGVLAAAAALALTLASCSDTSSGNADPESKTEKPQTVAEACGIIIKANAGVKVQLSDIEVDGEDSLMKGLESISSALASLAAIQDRITNKEVSAAFDANMVEQKWFLDFQKEYYSSTDEEGGQDGLNSVTPEVPEDPIPYDPRAEEFAARFEERLPALEAAQEKLVSLCGDEAR